MLHDQEGIKMWIRETFPQPDNNPDLRFRYQTIGKKNSFYFRRFS